MQDPTNLHLILASCFITSWVLTWLYRKIALRLMFVDVPNDRSAHYMATPTGAGIVFTLVFTLGLFALWHLSLVTNDMLLVMFAPIGVALLGFLDDIKPIGWKIRAPIHFLAAGWVIYLLSFPTLNVLDMQIQLGTFGLLFGTLALVWLLNLYNFMDGIDGIAISEIVFILLAAALLGSQASMWHSIQLLALLVCLPFLFFNWPKATIFMGDVGSGFLGLLLGILILNSDVISIWSWLILCAYFITDACLTITIRLFRKQKIWNAHSEHAYQHLTRKIGGKKTLYIVLLINCLWLLPVAALSEAYSEYGLFLLIFASSPLLVGQALAGSGQREPRLKMLKQNG